jgi:hypothetical protein
VRANVPLKRAMSVRNTILQDAFARKGRIAFIGSWGFVPSSGVMSSVFSMMMNSETTESPSESGDWEVKRETVEIHRRNFASSITRRIHDGMRDAERRRRGWSSVLVEYIRV